MAEHKQQSAIKNQSARVSRRVRLLAECRGSALPSELRVVFELSCWRMEMSRCVWMTGFFMCQSMQRGGGMIHDYTFLCVCYDVISSFNCDGVQLSTGIRVC